MSRRLQASAAQIDSRTPLLVRAAQALLLLKIAVALIVFDPNAADSFVLPKSAIGHALSVGLMGFVALCMARRFAAPRWSWVIVWASALTAAFAISAPLALDPTVALFGVDRRFLGLTHMADAFVIVLAVTLLFRTRRDLGLLLGAAAAATLVVMAYAIAQALGHDLVTFSEGTLRPIGTVGQPDTMGAFAGIAAITALTCAGILWRESQALGRVGLLAVSASSFVIAYADGARASLLAIGAGALAALALYLVARPKVTPWHVAIPAVLVLGTALVLSSPLANRISPETLANDRSVASRLQIWQSGLRMVAGRPLLGVGPDNFAVAYPAQRSDATVQLDGVDVMQTSTHSWPLYVLTSAGLAGVASLGAMLVAAALGAVRLRRLGNPASLALIPLAAYVGQGAVTITDPSLDWVAWVSLGVIASGSARAWAFGRELGALRFTAGLAIVCGLLLIPAFVDAQTRITASEAAGRSARLMALGRPLEAVAVASEGTRLDPRRGSYWARFGSALSAAGSPSAARAAYVDASAREPWQPVWQRDIGLQWLALGDSRRAMDSLREAIRLDPHDVLALDLLARLAVNSGDDAAGARFGDRAIELFPARVSFYEAPVAAHERLGEWDLAERDIRRGLDTQPTETDAVRLRVLLARLYLGSARLADARSELTWLLAHAPEDPDVAALRRQLPSP